MMLAVTAPVRYDFGMTNKHTRDVAGARNYFTAMAVGDGFGPLSKTVETLCDLATLQDIGFHLSYADMSVAPDPLHPAIVAEDQLAGRMGDEVSALLCERLRSRRGFAARLLLPWPGGGTCKSC